MAPDPDLYGPPERDDDDPAQDDDWEALIEHEPDRGLGEVTTTEQAIAWDKATRPRGLYDLPIFGWAWNEDAKDVER